MSSRRKKYTKQSRLCSFVTDSSVALNHLDVIILIINVIIIITIIIINDNIDDRRDGCVSLVLDNFRLGTRILLRA